MQEIALEEFKLNKVLVQKLELMAKRSTGENKQDNLILMISPEGVGKTNMSVIVAYYFSKLTNRKFDVDNIYFNVEKLIDVAKNTSDNIFIYDEPALDSLSTDWYKKSQKDLIRLLMMARKKRHFFIINMTKLTKFNEYMIDRATAMIRIYQRDASKTERRFLYYKKKALIKLYDKWRSSKKLLFDKYHSFHGTCPKYWLDKIINEELYEKRKDEAILSIGGAKEKRGVGFNEIEFKGKIINAMEIAHKTHGIAVKDLLKAFDLDKNTRCKWLKEIKNYSPKLYVPNSNNTDK